VKRAATVAGAVALLGLTACMLLGRGSGEALAGAQGAGRLPTAGDDFEPVLGMPAGDLRVLGSSPQEAKGEAWAYGDAGQLELLEHTEASGWQLIPLPAKPGGGSLGQAVGSGAFPGGAGRVTAAGGVVLLTEGGIVVRDPGGAPGLIPAPTAPEGGEEPPAPPPGGGAAYAATEEENGDTGLLIAPYNDGAEVEAGPAVMHYDGEKWTREAIESNGGATEALTPQALACGGTQASESASSPQNCWLLASYHLGGTGAEPNQLALFRRTPSKSATSADVWERVQVADWLLGEQTPPAGVTETPSVHTLGGGAQTLTVTAQGVWVDFQARTESKSNAHTDVSELVNAPPTDVASASVAGRWCYPIIVSACEQSLGAELPAQYHSFALPASSAGGAVEGPGQRIITGLPEGAMLELAGGGFEHVAGAGGQGGGEYGAAFSFTGKGSVEQGWIGEGEGSADDDEGESPIVEVTPEPPGNQLQEAPVPFRNPLLAVAQAPGSTPGDPSADAIAVGLGGEIGRYEPARGWSSESLYNSKGEAETPTLRGVAWPEPGRAYAVGDGGTMWLWRAQTGLWEQDPAKPLNFVGNLTAVAFDPSNPDLGYAVGKQGVLLKFGKSWEEISPSEREALERELKFGEQQLNFTSIAFAGSEALASYRYVNGEHEAGGLLVNDGSGWRVDHGVTALAGQPVLSKVAGLSDGGAVAAGPGLVIERDSATAPWRFSAPLLGAQNVSALAAYEEASGAVRAVVSIDLDPYLNPNYLPLIDGAFAGDLPAPSGPGQPPPRLSPDPLPDTGYVLKETDTGWSDIEHMALEAPGSQDMPVRPDPVLALLVSPNGSAGLVVGGQTSLVATAAAMRFGVSPSTAGGDTATPITTVKGNATFAVGGGAACEQACANFANEGLAPDVLLSHALLSANQIAASSPGGLRGFLYTGSVGGEDVFARDLANFGGSLPAYGPENGATAPGAEPGPVGTSAYSFVSSGDGGPVKLIVLAFSDEQQEVPWLKEELEVAACREAPKTPPGCKPMPAIAMGNASLGFTLPDRVGYDVNPYDAGAGAVSRVLVEGGASAYLFDYPGVNVQAQVSYNGRHIPAFGTGTLGYSSPPSRFQTDSLGSSGFLLAEVDPTPRTPTAADAAPYEVTAMVEPNIGQLALAPIDGTLLRRSQVGLFEALARIPESGRAISVAGSGDVTFLGPEPYEPIPFDCQGANCVDQVQTDFTFTSSNPDIGDFVAHEAASADPHQVQLGANGRPLPDSHSGLFCAYNEGTTTVSITAGGLSYSEPVTVQGGSVEYPCGTVPLTNPPARQAPARSSFPTPTLAPATNPPPNAQIQAIAPPPPPPVVHHARVPPALPAVPLALPALFPLRPVLPPPAPNPARPTPPSGTAPVYQPVAIAEHQHEHERATETIHHMTALDHAPRPVHRFDSLGSRVGEVGPAQAATNPPAPSYGGLEAFHGDDGPMPAWPLALVLVAVASGIGLRWRAGSERLERVWLRSGEGDRR
jgi:hypothetical protein